MNESLQIQEDISPRIADLAAEIERRLALIPRRAPVDVQREEPAVPEPSDGGMFVFPEPGVYPCVRCMSFVDRPGVCDGCGDALRAEEYGRMSAAALASIPEAYNCAGDDLVQRVRTNTKAGPERAAAVAAAEIGSGALLMVTFVGLARAGKSSLAAAVMRAVVHAGAAAHVGHKDPAPTNRLDALPPTEPRRVGLGRGARWIEAGRLWRDGRRTEEASIAEHCPMAVIDDVGQEVTEPGARADVTKEVLLTRWRMRLPTIVTTGLTPQAIEHLYGSGIRGRLLDPPAKVLKFGMP